MPFERSLNGSPTVPDPWWTRGFLHPARSQRQEIKIYKKDQIKIRDAGKKRHRNEKDRTERKKNEGETAGLAGCGGRENGNEMKKAKE